MSNSIGTGFSPSATGKSGWSTGGLGDLVGYIPGLGINILIGGNTALARPSLGGGLRGYMPQSVINHDNADEFAQTRFLLKDAWNTSSLSGSSNPKRMIGLFALLIMLVIFSVVKIILAAELSKVSKVALG